MRGQNLPDPHHIVRHVSAGRLEKDEDGKPTGRPTFAAFQRRPEEEGLSVTWQEYFAGSLEEQRTAAVHAIRATRRIGRNDGYAIGNVGGIKDTCRASLGRKIRVIHWPTDGNAAHAEVRQLPEDDRRLFEVLATTVWSEVVLDRSVTAGQVPAPPGPAHPSREPEE